MPGPTNWRANLITLCLNSRKIQGLTLEKRASAVLELIKRVMANGTPENAPEGTINTEETSRMLRNIGSSSLVLLKNDHNLLPLKKEKTVGAIVIAASGD
jgi:beta-glucosidase